MNISHSEGMTMVEGMALWCIAVFVDDCGVLCLHWGRCVVHPLMIVFSVVFNLSCRVAASTPTLLL